MAAGYALMAILVGALTFLLSPTWLWGLVLAPLGASAAVMIAAGIRLSTSRSDESRSAPRPSDPAS